MVQIKPAFQLSEKTHTGTVSLKVKDLEKQRNFYTSIIGLEIFKESPKQVILTAQKNSIPLLILNKIEQPLPLTRKTGLFHVAFLLPTRKDLGNELLHLLRVKAPLDGASDHGYSEALYLTDPEGNGIEIYRDKPQNEWEVMSDGEVPAITIEMDADGVIAAADGNWQGFPQGTKVGHVHLKVADLLKTQTFYTTILGLTLTTNYTDQAKFFATGSYHHHIGSNIWNGRNLSAMTENDLGLAYFAFFVPDYTELARVQNHWNEQHVAYTADEEKSQLWVTDPNGIRILFTIE